MPKTLDAAVAYVNWIEPVDDDGRKDKMEGWEPSLPQAV